MLSMSLRLPPGVFISITIAAALLFCAVETTRDMNVEEPGSTGKLKSAMITVFPVPAPATGLAETRRLSAASMKKPIKTMQSRSVHKSFLGDVMVSSLLPI